MSNKILIADIETTGFSPTKNKIVEIGIVELDLSNGNIEELYNFCIRDHGITSEEIDRSWIYRYSDIKKDDILNAPSLVDEFNMIQSIFNSYPLGITAYNNSFDIGFLKARGFRWHKTLPCPMQLSTDICRIRGKKNGYKWPTVQEAYNYFYPGSNYIEKHRGADDARHEAEIVYKLFKLGVFKL